LLQGKVFATRKQLDEFLAEAVQRGRGGRKLAVRNLRVITPAEYAARAGSDEGRKFLGGLRGARLRVVLVDLEVEGRNDAGVAFVRLVGGRAEVIGLGEERHARKK